jgi:dTDP-4-dehydrorhamnose reductase
MDRLSILITGGNGYIAQSLYKALNNKYNITLITRKDFDLNNEEQTINYFKNKFFDFVIHTAIIGGSRLKDEDESVIVSNLKMYQNLLNNRNNYGKFISFGSGEELGNPTTPYGKSKKIIADSMLQQEGFLNVRIFAVFDEHELDTRFIKANIKRYINNQPIIIHEDKFMDFFYMKDFIKLIDYFLQKEEWLISEIDCTYLQSYKLSEIAEIINQLSNYKVPIEFGNIIGNSYIGTHKTLPIDLIGLEQGIKNVYNTIKNEH